jgi:hypothetical protein
MQTTLTQLQAALDPARFFAAALGYPPDDWQRRVLRSPSQRIILNNSRQSGKSTVCAALALHTALYVPESLTLLVSPTQRQSQELFKKCLASYRLLGRPVGAAAESTKSLTLANGSRIVSLPGDATTTRGYSGVALLIVDEASRVLDDLYVALRPMIAVSGGRIVLLSTPYGRRGFFYDVWLSGGAAWHREEIPATACPRIDPAFLAEERQALGYWFEQEYMNVFLDTQAQLFATDDIEAAVTDDLTPLWG